MKRLSQLILLSLSIVLVSTSVTSAQTVFRLENGYSKMNMSVGGTTDGSSMIQKSEIRAGGHWVMEKQGDLYKIQNKATGLYMAAKGKELVLVEKAGSTALWNIIKSEKLEGYVQVVNSSNFLSASSMNSKEETSVVSFQKPGESATFWKMIKVKQ